MSARKVIFVNRQCAGDVIALTCAIRALHQSQPGAFVTDVRTNCPELFENNPDITPLREWESQIVQADYGYAIQNAHNGLHFYHGFTDCLATALGVHIEVKEFRGHVYLTDEEKQPFPGLPPRYWVLNAGYKTDFPAKQLSLRVLQEVVDALNGKIDFVQVGTRNETNIHPVIDGVTDLVGKTCLRDMVRVMYGADGQLGPISFPMHLAAATPTKDGRLRASVDILGAREQSSWEYLPGHTVFQSIGKLGCCRTGACWKTRFPPKAGEARPVANVVFQGMHGDIVTTKKENASGDCLMPVDDAGQTVAQCISMISAQQIVDAILSYRDINQ